MHEEQEVSRNPDADRRNDLPTGRLSGFWIFEWMNENLREETHGPGAVESDSRRSLSSWTRSRAQRTDRFVIFPLIRFRSDTCLVRFLQFGGRKCVSCMQRAKRGIWSGYRFLAEAGIEGIESDARCTLETAEINSAAFRGRTSGLRCDSRATKPPVEEVCGFCGLGSRAALNESWRGKWH